MIDSIMIGIDEHSEDNDFGLIDPALSTIGGTVFYDDEDDNGYTGDVALPGYTVELLDDT